MTRRDLENMKLTQPDAAVGRRVRENWDRIAKPLDGLGEFERIIGRIGAITGTERPCVRPRAILVMCADNGIVAEGVSQTGQEVSSAVAACMGRGESSVGRMSDCAKVDVIVTDIGLADTGNADLAGVRNRRIRSGTRDFLLEPAMTEEETLAAVEVGVRTVHEAAEQGYRILGMGEMGIGNTTTSSAAAAALLGCNAAEVTGRGAGLSDEGLARKREVIALALEKYAFSPDEAFRVLMTVGGLDIAGLTGVCIGGALCHIPIVMDGVISAVAALTAERLAPGVKEFLIASHLSREPAAARILEELGARPVIDAGLSLGEGTGAVMLFALLDQAMALYESGTTFEGMRVEPYERRS